MTLYLLNFNNYYNRIIKRYDTISGYEENADVLAIFENINFNPNDGIYTSQIINYSGNDGNYVICTDVSERGIEEIKSRWFILDSKRTRAGQFDLSLYRDLISDWYGDIINAPMFIEKAKLKKDDPLLFNNENMTFNQIKKSEYLLKDKTGCPWIIGYYSKNTPADNLKGVVSRNDLDDIYDIKIDTAFSNWKYNATTNPFLLEPSAIEYRIYAMQMSAPIGFQSQQGYLRFDKSGSFIKWNWVDDLSTSLSCNFKGDLAGSELAPKFAEKKDSLYSALGGYTTITSSADTNYFLNLNGKILKDSTGKYYQLSIIRGGTETVLVNITAGNLYQSLSSIVNSSTIITGNPGSGSFTVLVTRERCKMEAIELSGYETTWDMTGDKIVTEDSVYNIFAIPYGNVQLKSNGNTIVTSNKEIGIATASSIISTMSPSSSGGFLYDIQLLPYCPLSTDEDGIISFTATETSNYSLIRDPAENGQLGNPVGFILNIPNAQFTKNISYEIEEPKTPEDIKVSNECDRYRLCSPNFNGYFDFSIAKNKGITYFNIDCTYKPYQPYIHINPDFKNLYGSDFNDPRGLICNGDFSLSQISDAWQTYQIQNKNFQEIFNRSIENMEVNNSIQRIQDVANMITGTVSGTTMGGLAGSSFGGTGTAIGAAVGGVSSLSGGIADFVLNEKLRNEAIDYTKDQFGYQLGNIQALPYTLTKVTSLNYNNKIFPILEYYSCTDREKNAFKEKLKYNGMTVMCIGKIADYLLPEEKIYVKCKLIRIEDFDKSFQIINQIANELNKGVYI